MGSREGLGLLDDTRPLLLRSLAARAHQQYDRHESGEPDQVEEPLSPVGLREKVHDSSRYETVPGTATLGMIRPRSTDAAVGVPVGCGCVDGDRVRQHDDHDGGLHARDGWPSRLA